MTWRTFDELGKELRAAFPGYHVKMHLDEDDEIISIRVGKSPEVSTSANCSKELIYETVANRVLEFERTVVLFANSKNPVFI